MGVLILHDAEGDREFALADSRPVFIGRIKECEIHLPSPAVSRQHAVLIEKNGVCGIKDLDSSNGTYVNGTRIRRSIRLYNGDIIQIAQFTFEFSSGEAASTIFEEPNVASSLRQTAKTPAGDSTPKPNSGPEPTPESKSRLELEPEPISESKPPPKPKAAPAPEPKPPPDSRTKTEVAAKTGPAANPEAAREPTPAAPAEAAPPPDPEPEEEERPGPTPVPATEPKPEPEPESAQTPFPPEPKQAAVDDDEDYLDPRLLKTTLTDMGDGFADDDPPGEEDTDTPEALPSTDEASARREAALNKAAAEAGIVGEFAPEVEDEAQGGAAEEAKKTPRIPLSPALKNLIEARLSLYSFLDDLANERQALLERRPDMPEAAKNELARQDREKAKLPTAEQAKNMMDKRAARRKDLEEKRKKAKESGETPPPKPSKYMVEAEDLADSQWSLIVSSEEEALPALLEKASELCREEPLMKDLAESGIDAGFVMGGGVYYLALESLLEEAQEGRKALRAEMSSVAPEKKAGFRLFGSRGNDDDDDEDDEAPRADPAKLKEEEQALAVRVSGINQEMADLEKKLIKEFWRVYVKAALVHIPKFDSMPWPVRAFLRHGAVGYAPWWMPPEIREFIRRDCTEEIRGEWDGAATATHVLYADEYIRAVANRDCTPALDENLELNERNSPNWKADKALRKLIYSRSQLTLLDGLLGDIREKVDRLQGEHDRFGEQAKKILHGAKNEKQQRRELQQKQQGLKVEMSKLNKLSEKISTQTLVQMREAVEDTEKRFADGELPRPSPEFIIERECDAVHKIARLLANLKERYMPLVVRDYKLDTDAMNDRLAVCAEVADIERRDPAVFLETLVPSKRKKDRVDLRISPCIVILPSAGILAYSWNPRGGPENGRMAVPSCFIRQRLRERQMTYLFADFRWDTSKANAGMDLMTSETIVAAFMTVRWDWRKRSREAREKGLVFNDQNDRTNWRRVYEAYIQTAMDAGKKLYNRNYDFYERVIGRYFDLPEGLTLLKK